MHGVKGGLADTQTEAKQEGSVCLAAAAICKGVSSSC